MALTKTAGTVVLAPQQLAANTMVTSSAIDAATFIAATFFINEGHDDTGGTPTAATIRIQGSGKATGDDQWIDLHTITTGIVTPVTEPVTGTEAIGATVIECASTTGIVAGDILVFKNTVIANSEWHRVKSIVADTSFTIEDGLTFAQTGSAVYDQGVRYAVPIDCTAITRMRIQVDNMTNGRSIMVEAIMVSAALT